MAKTVEQGFLGLKKNLEITNLQEQTVSDRQQSVRNCVEEGMVVLDSFLTGSYRRSTMISPLKEADIDVFMVLDPKYYQTLGQGQLLADTRTTLRKKYPRTPKINANGQAVTITFTDFVVDVVPGFYRTGGGYLIPDANQKRWIETDPKRHVEIWTAKNKEHSGDLIPMIKMLKAWNKSTKVFRSFHLEALALAVFQGVKISDFPSGVRYFFDKARNNIRVKVADPAGYSDDIAAHVNTEQQISTIISRLDSAYNKAMNAERCSALYYEKTAYDIWRDIFNGYFPPYG